MTRPLTLIELKAELAEAEDAIAQLTARIDAQPYTITGAEIVDRLSRRLANIEYYKSQVLTAIDRIEQAEGTNDK